MSGGTYVALGSSMAAGPGIAPRVAGSPFRAGRSARNYPHLAAELMGMELVDVTYSGATTAHILAERQNGAPLQIEAVTADAALVTITIGGNDIGYVPFLTAAALPRFTHRIPLVGKQIQSMLDPEARETALGVVGASLRAVGEAVRQRAPDATVVFVDYLTLLPPAGTPAPPLSSENADLGRHLATRLEELTAEAAAATGCGLVQAAAASRHHHAWSDVPWTIGARGPLVPTFGDRPIRFHPNRAGMRAVAELVAGAVEG